jgi:hypothetical protein
MEMMIWVWPSHKWQLASQDNYQLLFFGPPLICIIHLSLICFRLAALAIPTKVGICFLCFFFVWTNNQNFWFNIINTYVSIIEFRYPHNCLDFSTEISTSKIPPSWTSWSKKERGNPKTWTLIDIKQCSNAVIFCFSIESTFVARGLTKRGEKKKCRMENIIFKSLILSSQIPLSEGLTTEGKSEKRTVGKLFWSEVSRVF